MPTRNAREFFDKVIADHNYSNDTPVTAEQLAPLYEQWHRVVHHIGVLPTLAVLYADDETIVSIYKNDTVLIGISADGSPMHVSCTAPGVDVGNEDPISEKDLSSELLWYLRDDALVPAFNAAVREAQATISEDLDSNEVAELLTTVVGLLREIRTIPFHMQFNRNYTMWIFLRSGSLALLVSKNKETYILVSPSDMNTYRVSSTPDKWPEHLTELIKTDPKSCLT